jgi:alanyl-tRNA synthetase
MGIIAGAVMAGLAILSSVKKNQEQGAMAAADAKAQQAAWVQRLNDTRENYKQIARASQQVNREKNEDIIQNQTSLAQQKADVELMAGASGTGGNAITSMIGDLSRTAGQNQSRIINNYDSEQQNMANQLRQAQLGGQVEMRQFRKPSSSDYLLGGLSSGMQGFMAGKSGGDALGKAWGDSRMATPNIAKN